MCVGDARVDGGGGRRARAEATEEVLAGRVDARAVADDGVRGGARRESIEGDARGGGDRGRAVGTGWGREFVVDGGAVARVAPRARRDGADADATIRTV